MIKSNLYVLVNHKHLFSYQLNFSGRELIKLLSRIIYFDNQNKITYRKKYYLYQDVPKLIEQIILLDWDEGIFNYSKSNFRKIDNKKPNEIIDNNAGFLFIELNHKTKSKYCFLLNKKYMDVRNFIEEFSSNLDKIEKSTNLTLSKKFIKLIETNSKIMSDEEIKYFINKI